jgi:hypothetical protein
VDTGLLWITTFVLGGVAAVDLLLMPPTGVTRDSQEALSISPACGVYEM